VTPPIDAASAPIIAIILITLGYVAACAYKPFAPCGKCDGNGKTRKPRGRVWRRCRRCRGTGLRLRWGRRIYNVVRRLWADGTRHTHPADLRRLSRTGRNDWDRSW
jgi:hypothetical protein